MKSLRLEGDEMDEEVVGLQGFNGINFFIFYYLLLF